MRLDLLPWDGPPLPWLEVTKNETAEGDPAQSSHFPPEGREKASNLAVPPLSEDHRQVRLPPRALSQLETMECQALSTAFHAGLGLSYRLRPEVSSHRHQVRPLDPVGGITEPVGETRVVREQQQARCRLVEPTDRCKVSDLTVQQIENGGTPLGIARGGHDPPRFVQEHGSPRGPGEQLSVDGDACSLRDDGSPRIQLLTSGDTDPPGRNPLTGDPARGDSQL